MNRDCISLDEGRFLREQVTASHCLGARLQRRQSHAQHCVAGGHSKRQWAEGRDVQDSYKEESLLCVSPLWHSPLFSWDGCFGTCYFGQQCP